MEEQATTQASPPNHHKRDGYSGNIIIKNSGSTITNVVVSYCSSISGVSQSTSSAIDTIGVSSKSVATSASGFTMDVSGGTNYWYVAFSDDSAGNLRTGGVQFDPVAPTGGQIPPPPFSFIITFTFLGGGQFQVSISDSADKDYGSSAAVNVYQNGPSC